MSQIATGMKVDNFERWGRVCEMVRPGARVTSRSICPHK